MREQLDHTQQNSDVGGGLDIRPAKPKLPVWVLGLAGCAAIVESLFVVDDQIRLGTLMFGVIVLIFALLLVGLKIIQTQKQTHATQALIALVDNDAPPCFLTNTEGQISFRNEAASERFKDRAVETLGRAFTKLLANPGSVLYRLQSKAHALGGAREDIVTRKGHVRLSVSAVKPATYICRIGAAVHARPTHLVCPS